jgi:3'(2'), 5'-bisphosphate nucleotidase
MKNLFWTRIEYGKRFDTMTSAVTDAGTINAVIGLAREAGRKIMEIYDSGEFATEIKSDDSPLTAADLASNKIILEGLKNISDYPVLSEETPVDWKTRKNWRTFWLVDPLDGTKDFIAKNGQFTVNIALIENNAPVLGVIHIPADGTTYWAFHGGGAFRDGVRITNDGKRGVLVGADSVFHSTAATAAFFEKHNITDIRRIGSWIKYCRLAEGAIDIYPRLNGTKEWDTAAGQVILEEAACSMIDIATICGAATMRHSNGDGATTGKPLRYNKPDIRNNHFIAMRNNLMETFL